MEQNFLQTFWDLSSVEDEKRIEAAGALLTLLKKHQAAQSTERGVSSELEYAVQRLVKGLGSNRKGARHGFYTALTQVLVEFPEVTVQRVLELVHAHLEPKGGTKAAEERGLCFGKGFALLSLVCSGKLSTEEDFVGVAQQAMSLGKKKWFLHEFCTSVTCQLLSVCPEDMCLEHVVPVLDMSAGWKEKCSVAQLHLLLHLSTLYSKAKWYRLYLQEHWLCKHIWSPKNFPHMATVLLESSSSLPRLHSVWPLVLEAVRDKGHFREFWNVVVEEGLMQSSHERRFVGFQVCGSLLPSLTAQEVGVVFSPNLLNCLVNNARSSENYLHSAAKHLLKELSECIEKTSDQQLLASLLLHLQRCTKGKFDSLVGSKVIEGLLPKLDMDYFLNTLQQLLVRVDGERAGEERQEEQLWAVEQVLGVVRNPRVQRRGSWLVAAATFLMGHAFFTISTTSSAEDELPCPLTPTTTPLEPSIRVVCQQRFVSVVSDLSSMALPVGGGANTGCHVPGALPEEGGASTGHRPQRHPPGTQENGEPFLVALLHICRQLMVTDGIEAMHPFTEKEQEAWSTLCTTVDEISNKPSPDTEVEDKAFHLLFSSCGLCLLPPDTDQRERARHTILELGVCHMEMREELRSKKGRTPRKKKVEKPSSKWMAVLTDLLLALLSQPSQLWRTVVEQVFRLLTGHVTLECLELILGVLKPKQDLGDVMEEEEGSEGEEEEEEEEVEREEGEEEEEEESSESDEGEEEAGVDPAFAAEVRKALGAAAAVDSDDESEGSVDDDAMMAVDEALGQVFRTRFALKHQKKHRKDDEKSLLHFKLRVLDLVELFVQREPSNHLVLELLLPLYEVVQAAQSSRANSPLVERVTGILKNRFFHAKTYPKSGLDKDAVHDKLKQIIQWLYKSTPTTSPLGIGGIMFLLRVLRGCTRPPLISPLTTRAGRKRRKGEEQGEGSGGCHGELDVSVVTEWFAAALHNFMTVKNSNIPPTLFLTYTQRYPELAAGLVPTMLQDLPNITNHFRKTQIYDVLAIILRGSAGEGELKEVWSKLSPEDAEAIHARTKSKKRSKAKKRKVQEKEES